MPDFQITDNSDHFKSEMKNKLEAALEAVGLTAEGYAKANTPVDTGRLRNSITHATAKYSGVGTYEDNTGNSFTDATANSTPEEDEVYIGTNVEYATSVEFNDSVSHKTGSAHFLRDATTKRTDEYKELVEAILKA